MAAASFKLYSLFPSLLVISFIYLSSIEASNGGFSVDLIQRDSPLSPFYNPLDSRLDHLHNAFRRSISRISHFKRTSVSPNTIQSQIIPDNGEYLMNISIGTPPVERLVIADTGSDLIWTQCKPCENCYDQIAPLFDPKQSSTYRNIPCQSRACSAVGRSICGGPSQNICEYTYSYGDKSLTNGFLAVETFTVGSTSGRPNSLPKIVFGCGHHNEGTFDKEGSGLIGLGGGSLSLISQLGVSIGGKFSYCLVPMFTESNATSKINFGSNGVVSGSGVVSTPLVAKDPDTFYYLTLEGISVGNKRLAYKGSSKAVVSEDEGNIIIDSGTTLTFLPSGFYAKLESALEEAIDGERVDDPQGLFNLCYETKTDIDVPIITAHFTDADLKLNYLNTFVRMEEDIVCFTMVPSDDIAIFGNLSQMNFIIGYDLVKKTVSFKPADCTQH